MSERVELRRPGTANGIHVTRGSADYWRSLGYEDVKAPAPAQEKPKAAPRKRTAAKKSSK